MEKLLAVEQARGGEWRNGADNSLARVTLTTFHTTLKKNTSLFNGYLITSIRAFNGFTQNVVRGFNGYFYTVYEVYNIHNIHERATSLHIGACYKRYDTNIKISTYNISGI